MEVKVTVDQSSNLFFKENTTRRKVFSTFAYADLPQMPGGTVVFEVELVHAEEGPRHPKVFKRMDIDGDKFLSKFEVRFYSRPSLHLSRSFCVTL